MQQIGKALMLPVSVLPVAGILLGVGSSKYSWVPDNLNELLKSSASIFMTLPLLTAIGVTILKIMAESGNVIFANLPLIFAIGVALGLTKNDGVSALAAVVGYMVMNATMGVMAQIQGAENATSQIMGITSIDTGVFGGILIGIVAGYLFNKYYRIDLPPYLGFFAGKRFVPIVTAFAAIATGIVLSYIWPPIGGLISRAGNWAANGNQLFAGVLYGVVERALLPFGLHHIWNVPFFFQMGEFVDANGVVVHGDIQRFFAGDKTAGILGGGFLVKMWGLPAAAIAIWHCAKPENKVRIGGIMVSAALTSFLTGITEPIEFSFLFAAPILYVIHALLTGSAFFVMNYVDAHMGFTFSQGFIDYILYFNHDIRPAVVLVLGPIYALIYYGVFRFFITKFNLHTPGREETAEGESAVVTSGNSSDLAAKVLEALGGRQNLASLDACITRLRVGLHDIKAAKPDTLKALGAAGVVVVGNNLQAIFGTLSENLKSDIEEYIKSNGDANAAPLPTSAPKSEGVDLSKVTVSAPIKEKAQTFLNLCGDRHNLEEIRLVAMTRVSFKLKDSTKLKAEELEKANFNLMRFKDNKVHLLCDLEEAQEMAAAIYQA